jgi:hypothetical protein
LADKEKQILEKMKVLKSITMTVKSRQALVWSKVQNCIQYCKIRVICYGKANWTQWIILTGKNKLYMEWPLYYLYRNKRKVHMQTVHVNLS